MANLTCRFYRDKFPKIDDVVVVNVKRLEEMGAYVHMLEYNNIEGMILMSELTRRRIRSINKLIRVDRQETVMVIRVDEDKGYIDLSKRRTTADDIPKAEAKFAKAKHVNSLLRHVAHLLGYTSTEQLERLYDKTAWHFDEKYGKPAASFDAFKHAVTNPEVLDECEIDDETRKVLLAQIRQRLTPQPVRIRTGYVNHYRVHCLGPALVHPTDINVACYKYEGVDAVKAALKAGLALSNEQAPIKIHLIAPPTYVMTVQTLDKAVGMDVLSRASQTVEATICGAAGGQFDVKMPPKIVSDSDEALLAEQLQKLEIENREVAADDDDSEEEEDEGMPAPTGTLVNGE